MVVRAANSGSGRLVPGSGASQTVTAEREYYSELNSSLHSIEADFFQRIHRSPVDKLSFELDAEDCPVWIMTVRDMRRGSVGICARTHESGT